MIEMHIYMEMLIVFSLVFRWSTFLCPEMATRHDYYAHCTLRIIIMIMIMYFATI